MYDVSFVASVLEGFEGTLTELLAVTGGQPRVAVTLDSLKSQIESLRLSLEGGARSETSNQTVQ